ncbi:MAG: sugar transferase [Kangiellaceae bacterium]|nr:sugar transferase [Kangiellaceae bacterium]|tara:strand:- start:2134 stop:3552 length:1419 start_codon:yes stop_codon:yes gene_type:complete
MVNGAYGRSARRGTNILVAVEALILSLVVSGCFAVHLGGWNALKLPTATELAAMLLIVVGMLTAQLAVGLYDHKLRVSIRGIIRRVVVAAALSFFALEIVVYPIFDFLRFDADWFLALFFLLSSVSIIVFRYWATFFDVFGVARRRVLIFGAGNRAAFVEKKMRRRVDRIGFELFGFVRVDGDCESKGILDEKMVDLGEQSLLSFAKQHQIDEIVIANDERRGRLPVDDLFECKLYGITVVDLLSFIERETGQIAVNLINPSWIIFSEGFLSSNYLRVSLDYVFNAVLGLCVFLVTWPIMLITALIIYLEDGRETGASVFYKQKRVGLDGEPFYILKFRSMRPDAEKSGAKWAKKNDSRVTRIGGFLRKYRIDELPQIINVLKGEMGFVGPRPERPEFVEQLSQSIPYFEQRHNVKPGLTGWAQLKYPYGSSEEDAFEKLKFDLYYIKHRSILLDFLILVRTFEIVLFGKGR